MATTPRNAFRFLAWGMVERALVYTRARGDTRANPN